MPNYTIKFAELPDDLVVGHKTLPAALRQCLLLAMENNLQPQQTLPAVLPGKKSVFLSSLDAAKLEDYLQQPLGSAVLSGLVQSYLAMIEGEHKGAVPADKPELWPQQEQYRDILLQSMGQDSGRVVLAEGATGIGKSRAMIHAAIALVREKQRAVVIACPSLGGLQQMLKELQTVESQVPAAIALGRGNFFDPERALDVLREVPQDIADSVSDWILAGAPSKKQTLLSAAPFLGYLLEDLAEQLPEGVNLDSVRHDSANAQSEAEKMYQAVRANIQTAPLVFCSHAMLACDMRARRLGGEATSELLPDYGYLFIDEAHLFESSVAGIEAQTFSPLWLRSYLRKNSVGSRAATSQIENLCTAMIERGKQFRFCNLSVFHADWQDEAKVPGEVQVFLRDVEKLKDLIGKVLKKNSNSCLASIQSALYGILSRKRTLEINISPVRKYPSFACGPASLRYALEPLWSNPQLKGAALVSATLYLPVIGASRIVRSLFLPPEKVDISAPIVPAWVTAPVTLHIPRKPADYLPPQEGDFAERPPQDFTAAVSAWLDKIAQSCTEVVQSARGGTLILMSSYETAATLAQALCATFGARIFEQKPGEPFVNLKSRFMLAAQQGVRPVLIGVGQAWTGLDLKDCLSDEIIVRIPFASPGGRVSSGRGASQYDTAFQFRQGIGRLVRGPGCRDKHLWIMDGRIWTGNEKTYGVFRGILDDYRNRERF